MQGLPAFTVFDVETTGLDPLRGDRIIEIAGVRVENGEVRDDVTFDALVNPERPIPWEAKQIHKISDELVASAPTIDQVLPQFLEFAQNSILVAHNSNFDMSFLRVEKELCWGYVDLPECICTMVLSQNVFPGQFRHNLDVVAGRLGLQMPTVRHRAMPDVLLTAHALVKMLQMANINSLDELRQKAGKKQLVA